MKNTCQLLILNSLLLVEIEHLPLPPSSRYRLLKLQERAQKHDIRYRRKHRQPVCSCGRRLTSCLYGDSNTTALHDLFSSDAPSPPNRVNQSFGASLDGKVCSRPIQGKNIVLFSAQEHQKCSEIFKKPDE